MNRAAVTVRPPAAFGARPRTQAKVCVREKTASGIFLRRPAPHARRSAPRAAESQWVGHSATTNFTSDRSIGLNWYAYANGNPINFADPTGYGAQKVLGAMNSGLNALGMVGNSFLNLIPGQAAWQNSVASAQSGNYGQAAAHFGIMAAEQVLTVASLGTSASVGAVSRAGSTAVTAARVEAAVVSGTANPVPATMARVISGEGPFPMLGLRGSSDVFVTAADDIAGMNASQISRRLAIDASDTFTVIKFPAPAQGIASPINRLYPQFIGRGRTAGGAREFVIPNQPVPHGSTINIVR